MCIYINIKKKKKEIYSINICILLANKKKLLFKNILIKNNNK